MGQKPFFDHKCILDLENNFEKLGNSLDVQTVSRTIINFWVLRDIGPYVTDTFEKINFTLKNIKLGTCFLLLTFFENYNF